MTEPEWLSCSSPERMLRFVWASAGERKLRLFAVACVGRLRHLSGGEFARDLAAKYGPAAEFGRRLEIAERFADGAASLGELRAACEAGLNSRVIGAAPAPWQAEDFAEAAAGDACDPNASAAALWSMLFGQYAADPDAKTDSRGELPEGEEHRPQAALLRDVFGNPFRPVVFETMWRTEDVVALARGMYESRDFSPMPILGDALEDAGCGIADVLDHCRGSGPHVRGCWVADLILGVDSMGC